MEVLGEPQEEFLDEDQADLTGVKKESLNNEGPDLIGVGRVFDKLKKDMDLIEEGRDKQLVVRNGHCK